MLRRRRYEVVVEGLSGQAAAQRSVISDHRSEIEARESARLERARLEVIYGEGARAWRILVVRDDEILAEETPHRDLEPRRRAAERAPRVPSIAETPQDVAAPGPAVAPLADEVGPAIPRLDDEPSEALRRDDDAGPIPGWLIAQVEQSIARQRERTYGPARGDDRDDSPRR